MGLRMVGGRGGGGGGGVGALGAVATLGFLALVGLDEEVEVEAVGVAKKGERVSSR